MISRKIIWLPSINNVHTDIISSLENQLSNFYSHSSNYYDEIDFTANNWVNNAELPYLDIIEAANNSRRILEVGCGSANILKHRIEIQSKYYGCDFSEDLLSRNSANYPAANFLPLKTPNNLPYGNSLFDLVFSVFVLEHSTNPSLLLDECIRVLEPDGLLIILCPNFLDNGMMMSQRAGFTEGTTKDKLKRRKYLDALITFFDNRIRIPLYCQYLLYKVKKSPKFYLNVFPTVFSDNFIPDVDAIYVTSRQEVISYLKGRMLYIANSPQLYNYERKRKIIYLKFLKPWSTT